MKPYLQSLTPVRYARWRFILVSFIAAVFIITTLVCRSVCAQQASNNKTPPTSKETNKTDPAAEANAQTPPPPQDWLHRDKLTGDWGGARKKMEERGFAFELEFTQFYQGTASGGLEQDDAYGGRIDAEFKFDLGKMGLWKNGIIEAKAVTRYGKSVNELTGALLPANTALLVPAEEGTVTAVTTLKYTHIFLFEKPGDLFLMSVGKFDTIDLVADPLIGGAGLNKFLNLNQVAPPIGVRNVPPVSIGWVGAWVRKGEPFISLTVLDSQDSSTTVGLSNLFEEGITIMPAVTLPSQFFGRAGHHTFSYSYSDQRATPFDQLRQVILPERFGTPETVTGSSFWMYSFDQYISEVPGFPRTGWGLFGQFGTASRRTSPIQTWLTLGIGGNTPFKSRPRDWFGAAYSFSSISSDLKDALDPLVRLRDEHQFEGFYNFAVTPWLFLTGDIQVIRPTRPRAETAWVPGLRMKIVF